MRRHGRAALALGFVWALSMVLAYLWTVAGTVISYIDRTALGRGPNAWILLAEVVGGVAGMGLLCAAQFVYRARPIIPISLCALTAIGTLFILSSGNLRAALVACWIMIIAYAWGDSVLRRSGVKSGASEWICVALPAGLALLGFIVLAMGLAGLLHPAAILLALAILTAAQWRTVRQMLGAGLEAVRGWRDYNRALLASPSRAVVLLIVGLTALFNLLWALAPETRYDALNYQLPVPKYYLEAGRIIDLPYFWHSYFARLTNLIFLPALALGGQVAVKLIIWAIGAVAATSVYAIAGRLLDKEAALWGAALFYTTPIVCLLSTTAYVDLPLAMFLTGSWIAFLRWQERRERGWILACGILSGAAFGVKMYALFGLPVLGVALLYGALRERPWSAGLRTLGWLLVPAAAISLPFYALTHYFTGNPVFPLLNGIFKSPYWEPVNTLFDPDQFGSGRTLAGLLKAPFGLTFESRRFDEVLPSGGMGLSLVLLPLALRIRARREVWLLLAGIGAYLVCWGLSSQYARYYIPILPLVIAPAVVGLLGGPRRLGVGLLWVALLAQGVVIPLCFGDFIRRNPLPRVLGIESEEEYLSKSLLSYPAVRYLNSMISPGERVLGSNVEGIRYYIGAPLDTFNETRALRPLVQGVTPEQMAANLERRGYRYLIDYRFGKGWQAPYLLPEFLDRFATLEYSFNYTDVYRLSPRELVPRGAGENLLRNGGFEEKAGDGVTPAGWSAIAGMQRDAGREAGGSAICLSAGETLAQRVAVESGRLHTLGYYARAGQEGQLARLQVNWVDGGGRVLATSVEVMTLSAEWKWSRMAISAPERAASADVILTIHEQGRACFDDVWFGQGDRKAP